MLWKCHNILCVRVCEAFTHIFLSAILNRGRRYSSNVFYVNTARTHNVSDFSERDFFSLFVVITNVEINMTRKCESRRTNVSQHERATRKMKCGSKCVRQGKNRALTAHGLEVIFFFFFPRPKMMDWAEYTLSNVNEIHFLCFFGRKCCEMKSIGSCSCYSRHVPGDGDYQKLISYASQ